MTQTRPQPYPPANTIIQRRKRRHDPIEWLLGIVFGGALVCSILFALALSIGCIWLIVILTQDLARRLSA